MATVNVSLPDPIRRWVEARIKSGEYSNVGDYVRDLTRRDQEFQERREALVQALVTGEASGTSERTPAEIWRTVKARHGLDV